MSLPPILPLDSVSAASFFLDCLHNDEHSEHFSAFLKSAPSDEITSTHHAAPNQHLYLLTGRHDDDDDDDEEEDEAEENKVKSEQAAEVIGTDHSSWEEEEEDQGDVANGAAKWIPLSLADFMTFDPSPEDHVRTPSPERLAWEREKAKYRALQHSPSFQPSSTSSSKRNLPLSREEKRQKKKLKNARRTAKRMSKLLASEQAQPSTKSPSHSSSSS